MQQTEVRVAVAAHSGFGHTRRQAEAVARGAASVPGVATDLLDVVALSEDDWATLDRADAIVFGSPTYMGSPSAAFKAFAEATSEAWGDGMRWKDKLAAVFTNSQGDQWRQAELARLLCDPRGAARHALGQPRPLPRLEHERGQPGRSQPARQLSRRDGSIAWRRRRGRRARAERPRDGRGARSARCARRPAVGARARGRRERRCVGGRDKAIKPAPRLHGRRNRQRPRHGRCVDVVSRSGVRSAAHSRRGCEAFSCFRN
jgi:flavodoxin